VHFLRGAGVSRVGAKTYIRELFEGAVGFAGEGDDFCAFFLSQFNRPQYVFGCAAGGKGPEDVVFSDHRLDLADEDVAEVVVVAKAGEYGGVGGEGDSGQGAPFLPEAAYKLAGDVLTIGSRAAVAAKEYAAAVFERAAGNFSDAFYYAHAVLLEEVYRLNMIVYHF